MKSIETINCQTVLTQLYSLFLTLCHPYLDENIDDADKQCRRIKYTLKILTLRCNSNPTYCVVPGCPSQYVGIGITS